MEVYKKLVVRSELDRYGFSELLARRLGLKKPRRTYCAWTHGWIWWDVTRPEELGHVDYAKDVRIVCATEKQRQMMAEHGYSHAVAGGLPFAYVPPAKVERDKGSLLVFLPHSLDHYGVSLSAAAYLDYLSALKSEFSRIDVCIYGHDYDEGTQPRECVQRGLNPIRGARPDDAEALVKQRARLDRYEYVTSSTMGSHVAYAAYCGCKVSLTAPIFQFDRQTLEKDPHLQRYPALVGEFLELSGEAYLRKAFPWLVVDHPLKAVTNEAWAARELGADCVLADRALRSVLGWDAKGRVAGPLRGARRRIMRMVFG